MKRIVALLIAALGAVAGAQAPSQVVARLFGTPLTAAELEFDRGDTAHSAQLLKRRIEREVLQRFLQKNKLEASDADLAAYGKFDREFRQADRVRRARDLDRLEKELAAGIDDPRRRAQAESYRSTLQQLAKRDAEQVDPAADAASKRRVWKPWIEGYKLNKALYERYGGIVGITKFGPDPVGARVALLREHERNGDFTIEDASLRSAFWAEVDKPPRMIAKPADIDFTYYWLKPVAAANR
jgi:hypothetical protein